jgi:hypothetical protein
MSRHRLIFQDWIVGLGRDPEQSCSEYSTCIRPPDDGSPGPDDEQTVELRHTVSTALGQLDESEREFLVRFYFMGQSYKSIAEETGRALYKLEALHRRAVRRLQRLLAPYVCARYGISSSDRPACPICSSPDREQIDEVIRGRDRRQTWRPVLQTLKTRFGLDIKTPQTLIGHIKYH